MSSPNRVFVEISPYSLKLAVVAGRRLVAWADYPLEAKDAVSAFVAAQGAQAVVCASVSPRQAFAHLSGEESARVRTETDLLAFAQTLPTGLTPPLSAVACDAAAGKSIDPDSRDPWLLAGTTTDGLKAAKDQLAALGLSAPGPIGLALPAQLGAVVATLQDMPEATRVAVLAVGESSAVLCLVSANGVEAVCGAPAGYAQIFEAVQAELGLKFKAAATKLFFNTAYDFTDAADKIAARLAPALQGVLGEWAKPPAALQVLGLPPAQAWLASALAQAVALQTWAPDVAKVCAQLGLELTAGTDPKATALGLLQLAATDGVQTVAWRPFFLGETPRPAAVAAAAAPAPAPKAVPTPAARPAAQPLKPAAPAQTRAPFDKAALPAPPMPPKPPAKPAPVAAAPKPLAPPEPPRKPRRGLYAVLVAGLLIAIIGGIKFYSDAQKRAAARQTEEAAHQAAEQARKVESEKAAALTRINPATGLPGAWSRADIGTVKITGTGAYAASAVPKDGTFTLSGSGIDIWGKEDSFQYAYQPLQGDGTIIARVVTQSDNTGEKTGVMMRETLDAGSRHVNLSIQRTSGIKMEYRTVTGGGSGSSAAIMGKAAPHWLKLVRAGNVFTGYMSTDGVEWTRVGQRTNLMGSTIYIGLAQCAVNNTNHVYVSATATLDKVSITTP